MLSSEGLVLLVLKLPGCLLMIGSRLPLLAAADLSISFAIVSALLLSSSASNALLFELVGSVIINVTSVFGALSPRRNFSTNAGAVSSMQVIKRYKRFESSLMSLLRIMFQESVTILIWSLLASSFT